MEVYKVREKIKNPQKNKVGGWKTRINPWAIKMKMIIISDTMKENMLIIFAVSGNFFLST